MSRSRRENSDEFARRHYVVQLFCVKPKEELVLKYRSSHLKTVLVTVTVRTGRARCVVEPAIGSDSRIAVVFPSGSVETITSTRSNELNLPRAKARVCGRLRRQSEFLNIVDARASGGKICCVRADKVVVDVDAVACDVSGRCAAAVDRSTLAGIRS